MKSSRTNCSLTVEFSLVQENILIQKERISQLFVIQSEQDPFKWFGVLFVDTGMFMGAVIRFTMFIGDSYPNCPCPKIIFDTIPYHPLVDQETGELDTKNAFPDWSSSTHKLHQLLVFVKRVICQADMYIQQIQDLMGRHLSIGSYSDKEHEHDINNASDQTKTLTQLGGDSKETTVINQSIKSAKQYNPSIKIFFVNFENTFEIMKTYEINPNEFHDRVEAFKQKCCHQLFDEPKSDNDKNFLIFKPWNPDIHETIRNCVLAGRFAPTSLFASYHKETDSVSFVPGAELSE